MNKIILSGTVVEQPTFSHEIREQKFYNFKISSERHSGVLDILPCVVSKMLADEIAKHEKIKIVGEVRTRNVHTEEKSKLMIYVFVKEIMDYDGVDENSVKLEGFLCKKPIYRVTPRKKEIADLIVSCNRGYGKPDYIPCIAWSENSRKVSKMRFGTKVKLIGRLQSREYKKQLENGTAGKEIRIAYELSVSRVTEKGESDNASED